MLKKVLGLLLFGLVLAGFQTAKATHILGGEISYRCLNANGLFEFTVIVFRDCGGSTAGYGNTTINLLGPHGTTTLPLISSADVSPRCATGLAFSCNPPSTGQGAQGSISKFIFRGNVNLATVGVAPVGVGHTFWVTLPCCRSSAISNSLAVNGSQSLQVKMYRFTDPVTGNALTPAQLCDNSPTFIADPAAIAIQNLNDTIFFQNFAIDPDIQDSTVFSISAPLNDSRVPYAYTFPYSLSNPLPGILGPPTIAASNTPINPTSGEIVFRPTVAGTFVTVIQVTAYRCGQKIAEVFRDFNVKIIPNPGGAPPPFIPNPADPLHAFSQRAPIIQPYFRDALGRGLYAITYYAGDTIDIPVSATDYFPTLGGNPADPSTWVGLQNPFRVVFSGSVLSTTNSPAANCPFPPCATVRGITDPGPPAPPLNAPTILTGGNGQTIGLGYSALSEGGGRLIWLPACSNLPASATTACGTSVSSYQVAVTAVDQNCPVEGRDSRVYTFTIRDFPVLKAPRFFGVSANGSNNGVRIHMGPELDTLMVDPIDSFNYQNQTTAFKLFKSVDRRRRSFEFYRVYRSTSPTGPFTQVATINQLYTYTWDDTGLDLVANDYYYYLTTVSTCASVESEPSDTMKVIRLRLNNNVPAGLAELRWDSIGSPRYNYLPNHTGRYVIEREVFNVNPGVWERVDSVSDIYQYNQPVVVCDDSVNYRVALIDTNGTPYYSQIDGDDFRDIFPPDSVIIHHVSVDSTNGLPLLSWLPGPSPDVIAYVIYRMDLRFTPPVAIPIDTIYGFNNTYWWDTTSLQNPYDSSLHYGIAALDSCGNLGLISRTHSSMNLQGGLDQCISSIVFTWNAYRGWDQVANYEIYRSASGGAWSLLSTVAGGQPQYQYIDNNNLVTDSLYCYAIRATRPGDDTAALSNPICVTARVIKEPEYTYIRRVTVDSSSGYIHVRFAIDTAADAGKFELYRSTASSDFRLVDEFGPVNMRLNGGFLEYEFIDEEAEPHKEIYFYRVYAYDLCDQLFDTSNTSNNIYLQAVPEIDFFNNLRWNSYGTWLGGVDGYDVLRFIPEEDLTYVPLNRVGANSVVYADDIKNFTDNDGLYRYLVQAVEGAGNPAGFSDTSLSNAVDVIQQPRVFMPTAFMPLGVNRLLQPKGVFIEERAGYLFEIYNRWGELIFATNDFTKAWDGRHAGSGEYVDPGVYVFVMDFIGKNGKAYKQNGTFTVIR